MGHSQPGTYAQIGAAALICSILIPSRPAQALDAIPPAGSQAIFSDTSHSPKASIRTSLAYPSDGKLYANGEQGVQVHVAWQPGSAKGSLTVVLRVRNAANRVVYTESMPARSSQFTTAFDMSSMPRGSYSIQTELVNRRLLVASAGPMTLRKFKAASAAPAPTPQPTPIADPPPTGSPITSVGPWHTNDAFFGGGIRSIAVSYPTGIQAGDVCVAILFAGDNAIASAAGWTLQYSYSWNTSRTTSVLTHICGGGEGGTSQAFTYSKAVTTPTNVALGCYSGVNAASPVETYANSSGADRAFSVGPLMTTVANDQLIVGVGLLSTGAGSWSTPTGMNGAWALNSPGNNTTTAGWDEPLPSPGLSGSETGAYSYYNGFTWGATMLALQAANASASPTATPTALATPTAGFTPTATASTPTPTLTLLTPTPLSSPPSSTATASVTSLQTPTPVSTPTPPLTTPSFTPPATPLSTPTAASTPAPTPGAGASIARVGSWQTADAFFGSGLSGIAVNYPAGIEGGEVCVAIVFAGSSATASAGGWSRQYTQAWNVTSTTSVLTRITDGSESGASETFNFSTPVTAPANVALGCYSGVDTNSPIDAYTNSSAAAQTLSIGPLAPSAANDQLIVGVGLLTTGAGSWSTPGGMTNQWGLSSAGNNNTTAGWDQALGSAAPIGPQTAAYSYYNGFTWGATMLALRAGSAPAATPTPSATPPVATAAPTPTPSAAPTPTPAPAPTAMPSAGLTPAPSPSAAPPASPTPSSGPTPQPTATASGTISLTSPAAGAVVTGNVSFSAQANGASFAQVDYLVLGHSVTQGAPPTASPYSYTWNSNWYWNGAVQVVAVGEDSAGNPLAQSAPVAFTISNSDARVSTQNLRNGQVVSGKLAWSATAHDSNTVQAVGHILDGNQVWLSFFSPATADVTDNQYTLDTTSLSNGLHDLFLYEVPTAGAANNPNDNPVAMDDVQVDVENGHLPLALQAQWWDVYLAVGESTQLAPSMVYTDHTSAALSPASVSFSSDTPAVATVDSQGNLNALSQGVAFITLSSGGFSGITRVVVRPHDFPHFSKSGQILHAYTPGSSYWVRTLFNLDAGPLPDYGYVPDPATMHAAGVSAMNGGFFQNPADLGYSCPGSFNLSQWEAQWDDNYWTPKENWLKTNGFSFVATGDDMGRYGNEYSCSTSATGAQALQYALQRVLNGGSLSSIEAYDEQGGSVTSYWQTLIDVINGVSHPPMTWQVQALQSAQTDAAWMGNPAISQYATWYWGYANGAWRLQYPWAASNYADLLNMNQIVYDRLGYVQLEQPQLMLTQCTGPFYTKQSNASTYQPGQDYLEEPGTTPEQVAAEIMYAQAMGMAGVRAYAFDGGVWDYLRNADGPGTQNVQTGCAPAGAGAGQDRWAAMANAFNLIQSLEPYILQPPMNAINLGPLLVTGARQSSNARLLTVVNLSDQPQSATIDLSSYRYPSAASVTRYHVLGQRLVTESVANNSAASLTFQPAESIVWLFTP